MALSSLSTVRGMNLPPHCTPTTSFLFNISDYFGTCLPTPLGFTSTLLGYLSVLAWLFAQMPQVFKNFQLKSAAGLSAAFLIEWLLGDITNLLGCIFTGQATWQIVIACYYCFVDVCLVVQYFWYTYGLPWMREGSIYSSGSDIDDDASSDLINSLSPINSSFVDENRQLTKDSNQETSKPASNPSGKTQPVDTPRFHNVNYEKGATTHSLSSNGKQWASPSWSIPSWTGPSPRTIMYATTITSLATQTAAAPLTPIHSIGFWDGKSPIQIAGTIISWCSTALYLGSRLPQLYKNWKRKSTTGLSPYLFMAAFTGNLLYSASMLANPSVWHNLGPYGGHGWVGKDGSRRSSFIINAAPFFLGAAGVLVFDGTMGVQFLTYGEDREKIVKVRESHGPSRWQRVNGWMRGWIPTIKKEKIVDLAESQRLLSRSRELDRSVYQSRYGGT